MLKSIKLTNFLSFGPETQELELGPLNLLIGPNASGKSNLLEAINILSAAPRDIASPIRRGGGIQEMLWKKAPETPIATIEATVDYPSCFNADELYFRVAFTDSGFNFKLVDEFIRINRRVNTILYEFNKGEPFIFSNGKRRKLDSDDLEVNQSILSQRQDPDGYPEMSFLGRYLKSLQVYREWGYGRKAASLQTQKLDLLPKPLMPDAANLALVLSQLRLDPTARKAVVASLKELNPDIEGFEIGLVSSTAIIMIQERDVMIPSFRLSDGTLRYLCLLAVLCHPDPPPLVCLEEPEVGLHPDILPHLAELLKSASERCQLIVTTHSDILVDAMTDQPESVIICEKHDQQTTMERLDPKEIEDWLEDYRLGDLWTRGHLGGNRW